MKNFVRRAAAERFVRPVLVVPLGDESSARAGTTARVRDDGQAAQAFFQRADAAFDDRDAAVLAERAVARRPDAVAAGTSGESRGIVELRAPVADDVLGRGAGLWIVRPRKLRTALDDGWQENVAVPITRREK